MIESSSHFITSTVQRWRLGIEINMMVVQNWGDSPAHSLTGMNVIAKRSCVCVIFFCCSFAINCQFMFAEPPSRENQSVFAGNGNGSKQPAPYTEGSPTGPRLELAIGNPFGVEIVGEQIWLTSVDDHCIYQGALQHDSLKRVAGSGVQGYTGDGGPAIEATFNWPHEVRADDKGNLFVADTRNHVIRRIDHQTGIVTTIAGSGEAGFAGEGKSGAEVQFKQPHSVVLDGEGGLLVADTVNHRLRRIDLATGIVTTVSGTGKKMLPTDGADAKTSPLFGPRSLAVDESSIWIALREGNSIWRIDRKTSKLHNIAGTGAKGYSGDGGSPLAATFRGPKGLVIDNQQRLLVVDTENQAIRRIDLAKNRIDTVMGGTTAQAGFQLKRPHGISFAEPVGFIVADSENHRVLQGKN